MTSPLSMWDMDGTIMLNDMENPDWDNPSARHPTTLEPINGEMLLYWSHNYPNPELYPGDIENIRNILTGRPEIRRRRTTDELHRFGITQPKLIMYPDFFSWSTRKVVNWKAQQLSLAGASYYIDNDQAFNEQLQKKTNGKISCLTIAEYHDLIDAGIL